MTGFIAELGEDAFGHRFGGTSWAIEDREQLGAGPMLLLALDLADARVAALAPGWSGLPLVSHINDSVWLERQSYRIDLAHKRRRAGARGERSRNPRAGGPHAPAPAEAPLRLRAMAGDELARDPDAHDRAIEESSAATRSCASADRRCGCTCRTTSAARPDAP